MGAKPAGQKAGQKSAKSVGEWIDYCIYETPAGVTAFDCVARAGRAAARAYRRNAGSRTNESEIATLGSSIGLLGFAVSSGHRASDTMQAWSALAVAPIAMDEVAAPGPRAKIYNYGARAMTLATARAEQLAAAANVLAGLVPSAAPAEPAKGVAGGLPTLSDGLTEACGGLAVLEAPANITETNTAQGERQKFTRRYTASCETLEDRIDFLHRARIVWNQSSKAMAIPAGADIVTIDDTITALDRETVAPSRGAAAAIFGAVLSIPSVLTGDVTPKEYSGRSLVVFSSTYKIKLTKLPKLSVPGLIEDTVEAPASVLEVDKNGAIAKKIAEINRLISRVNEGVATADAFQELNNLSVLKIEPGSAAHPVELVTESDS